MCLFLGDHRVILKVKTALGSWKGQIADMVSLQKYYFTLQIFVGRDKTVFWRSLQLRMKEN